MKIGVQIIGGGLKFDAWKAKFELLDEAGRVETQQPTALSVDSAPGYVAAIQLPLQAKAITTGIHFLRFELRRPGTKKVVSRSAVIRID